MRATRASYPNRALVNHAASRHTPLAETEQTASPPLARGSVDPPTPGARPFRSRPPVPEPPVLLPPLRSPHPPLLPSTPPTLPPSSLAFASPQGIYLPWRPLLPPHPVLVRPCRSVSRSPCPCALSPSVWILVASAGSQVPSFIYVGTPLMRCLVVFRRGISSSTWDAWLSLLLNFCCSSHVC